MGKPQKGSVGLWMGTGQEEVAPPACPRLLEQLENRSQRAENKNRQAWRGRASRTDHPHGVTAVLGSPGTKTPRVRAHRGVREQGGPSLLLASTSKLKIK